MPRIDKSRCTHRKPDGTRCRATARPGKFVCTFHDPELAAKRTEGRRRGGVNRSQPAATLPSDTPDAPLDTVKDVAAFLAVTMNQVRTGRLAVSVANSLGILAGTLLKAIEGSELERRLAALEARQPPLNGRGIHR